MYFKYKEFPNIGKNSYICIVTHCKHAIIVRDFNISVLREGNNPNDGTREQIGICIFKKECRHKCKSKLCGKVF